MLELTKLRRVVKKKCPDREVGTWLVLDAMLGQSSFGQAKVFCQAASLDGVILSKFDGSGKGGIVFAIAEQFNLPVIYLTFGEGLDDLKLFDLDTYLKELLGH
jgi:fused signal recognition particle receptor